MEKLYQISLFVENKPGAISAPCRLLAEHGISISTLSLADTKFFGVLRLLVKDVDQTKQLLEANNYAVKLTEVVAIEVDHKPGSLAAILDILDRNGVNVEYMYAHAAGVGGKAALIFRFDDPESALNKLCSETQIRILTPENLFA